MMYVVYTESSDGLTMDAEAINHVCARIIEESTTILVMKNGCGNPSISERDLTKDIPRSPDGFPLAISYDDEATKVPTQCKYWMRDGRRCNTKIKKTFCSNHEGKVLYPICRSSKCTRTTRSYTGYCTHCEDGKAVHKQAFRDKIRKQREEAIGRA